MQTKLELNKLVKQFVNMWDTFLKHVPKLQLRRPLEDDYPEGYMESDQDFVLNNIEICVDLLNKLSALKVMVDKIERKD